MKLESKTLIYSMINNLIISIIKIIGGVFFNLGSLFSDGLQTFSDFVTDIISLIGSKISKKKPTKYHPFGYGKVEYLTNLFVGILLLLLSIFIIFHSLGSKTVIPPLSVLFILLVTIFLKVIAIIIMHKVGQKINSGVLITSVEESKTDLYASIGVVAITLILQFSKTYPILKYVDIIGSILIGLVVLKTALEIIAANSMSIIGEIEQDEEKINNVKEILKEFKKIEESDVELIKYGSYYKLQLSLKLDYKITLRQATNLVKKIKKTILRHRSLKIKYVTIYIED